MDKTTKAGQPWHGPHQFAAPGESFEAAKAMVTGTSVQRWRWLPGSMSEVQQRQLAKAIHVLQTREIAG